MMSDNTILPERSFLKVTVPVTDFRLVYLQEPVYRMVFRINIFNSGKMNIRLLARKWTILDKAGNMFIIEAERVFRSYPLIAPQGVFSYGGVRDFTQPPAQMELRIVGIDQMLMPFISTPCTFRKSQLEPKD